MYCFDWNHISSQTGAAVALGEQPIKGLIDPDIGARMSVGEALTNLVFAPISDLQVRYSNSRRSNYSVVVRMSNVAQTGCGQQNLLAKVSTWYAHAMQCVH
jgi:phosphoribosylformylglycinamidine (FGAM) synthase-like enzyme